MADLRNKSAKEGYKGDRSSDSGSEYELVDLVSPINPTVSGGAKCNAALPDKSLRYAGDSPLIDQGFRGFSPALFLSSSATVCREILTDTHFQNSTTLSACMRICSTHLFDWTRRAINVPVGTAEELYELFRPLIPRQAREPLDVENPRHFRIFPHNKSVSAMVAWTTFVASFADAPYQAFPIHRDHQFIEKALRNFLSQILILPVGENVDAMSMLKRSLVSQGTRAAFRSGNVQELLRLLKEVGDEGQEWFFEVLTIECRSWFEACREVLGAKERSGLSETEWCSLQDAKREELKKLHRALSVVTLHNLAWAYEQDPKPENPFPNEAGDLYLDPRYGFADSFKHLSPTCSYQDAQAKALFDIAGIGLVGGRRDVESLMREFTQNSTSSVRVPARKVLHDSKLVRLDV